MTGEPGSCAFCSFASASTAVDGTRDVPSLRGTVRWRMYSTSRAIRGSPGRACVCERVPGRRSPSNTENTPNRGNVPADSMPCRRGTFNGRNVESRNHQTVNIGDSVYGSSGRNLIGRESEICRKSCERKAKKRSPGSEPRGPKTSKNAKVWGEDTSTSTSSLAVAPCRPASRCRRLVRRDLTPEDLHAVCADARAAVHFLIFIGCLWSS